MFRKEKRKPYFSIRFIILSSVKLVWKVDYVVNSPDIWMRICRAWIVQKSVPTARTMLEQ